MRNLLFIMVAAGVLASQSAPGTLAFFTSTAVSADNVFTAGVIDLTKEVVNSGTATSFVQGSQVLSWTTSRGGTNCTNTLTGTDITTQNMAPGHFCVASVTVANDRGTNTIDSWMRWRLVRQTNAAGANSVNDELNNRLRVYAHEYTGGTDVQRSADRNLDCTAANYRPDTTSAAGSISTPTLLTGGTYSGAVTRKGLTSLNKDGAAIGTHPTATTDTNLLTATQLTTATRSGNSLGVTALGTGVAPTAITIEGAAANTYANLIGNDDITNPVRNTGTVATATTGVSAAGVISVTVATGLSISAGNLATVVTEGANPTEVRTVASYAAGVLTFTEELHSAHASGAVVNVDTKNGTNANGTNAESELLAATPIRYYCMAMFFPSDSGVNAGAGTGNTAGDNKAMNGTDSYSLVVTAAQKAGRTSTN